MSADVRVVDAAKRAGITYRQLDYWMRNGAVIIADNSKGSGNHRWLTAEESDDLVVLGRLIRAAERAGFTPTRRVISEIWAAITAGRTWSVTLSTDTQLPDQLRRVAS